MSAGTTGQTTGEEWPRRGEPDGRGPRIDPGEAAQRAVSSRRSHTPSTQKLWARRRCARHCWSG